MHVVLAYFAISREKRLTTRVAGTSSRVVVNDYPSLIQASVKAAARVLQEILKERHVRELALREYFKRCKLIP